MNKSSFLQAFLALLFSWGLGSMIYSHGKEYLETDCIRWRSGLACGAGAYVPYIFLSLFSLSMICGAWLLVNPKYKKEKERKLQEELREKYPKDTQPPMTSLEEINNELERKIEKTSSEVKGWLQENITSPEKVILVKELDTGEKIECWLLTKKEAPYFLIYNQEKNKFGLGSQMKDKTLWYMNDYDSFYQAVSDLYSFFLEHDK